jgi:hypothetical protein
MLKTPELENEINQFQNGFKTGDTFFIKYGSFFRKDKKYVNDIDIYQIYKKHISYNTQTIILTIETMVNHSNIFDIQIFCGNNDYYKKTIDLNLLKDMLKNQIINKKKFDELKYLIELKADQNTLKLHIQKITYIKWNIEDIRKGYTTQFDKKYYFREILKKNDYIIIDFIYKYNNNYVNIEYTVTDDYGFNESRKPKDGNSIYNGCKLPQYAFLLKDYYKTIKRLKSCYAVNIRDKLYKSLNEKDKEYLYNAFKNLDQILKDKELYISQYNLDTATARVNKDTKTKEKKEKMFNQTFKKIATEHYYKGVEHHLIY